MTPTNEQLQEHLMQLGSKLDDTGEFLESVAFALAKQYELIAGRMPELLPEERVVLRSCAQQVLESVKKHTMSRKLLRDALHNLSKN